MNPDPINPIRLALAATAVLAALVVQLSVLSRLGLPGATPDLVLLVVVGIALATGPDEGLVAGAVAGLATDLAPPADHAVGRWLLVLGLVGYGAGHAGAAARRSPLVPVAVVAGSAAASVLLYAATGAILGDLHDSTGVVIRLVATAVLYDVVLSPFVVPAVLAVARRVERDPSTRS